MNATDTLKIVYIEDDPEMIDLVTVVLERENFEVIGVLEGRKGLETIREVKPTLVLLDLMLPDMGGWAIYQKMKESPELSEIPVIVITAQNAPIDVLLGRHIAKVQVYMTKPFSPAKLRENVRKVLGDTTET